MLCGMDRDEMRAGDGDRQAVAEKLKNALDEGRLDLGEYDERLQRTYSAKTYGDLQELVTDLPGTIPLQHSQVQPLATESPVVETGASRGGMPSWLGPYAGVVAVSVLIWAIVSISTGELLYFWPIWMFIPLIFGVLGQMTGRGGNGRDRGRNRDR
jgi:uncharacterized protein DUF1707